MNLLGTLIRSTASSNQFLRYSSRFFSHGTDGGSAVYHHARLFRKPLSVGFKATLSNSVSLVGFVDQPLGVIDSDPPSFGVSTLLRVKDPRDPNRPTFRIPLTIWDVMARRCIGHLKPNDHILVLGRLVSYKKGSSNETDGLGLGYQVKVTDVNYVMAPPSQVLDSQISQNPKPETGMGREDGVEELRNDTIYLWQVFFANPHEWWDNRRNKRNPRQPDFKHKDTGEALWLSSNSPAWVTRQLELFDQRMANKGCYDQEHARRGRLSDWV